MTESDDLSVYPSTHEIVIRGLAPLSMRLDCDHTRIPVEVSTAAYLQVEVEAASFTFTPKTAGCFSPQCCVHIKKTFDISLSNASNPNGV